MWSLPKICGAAFAAAVLPEVVRPCRLEGDAALLVVGLRHIEVECADGAMSCPGEANHSRKPRQGAGVAGPDAVRRQHQPAHGHRPQKSADVGDQPFGEIRLAPSTPSR